ncbi:MAG: hypothetical protein K8S54_20065 [Spirochaetia bacterium]|nr:hypothetical protein [Spirochaetia bacterium]
MRKFSILLSLCMLVTGCDLVVPNSNDADQKQQNLILAAAAIAASNTFNGPEIAGNWNTGGACAATFTVSVVSNLWNAFSDAEASCSFTARHLIRDYDNSLRRYYYECTAQTGFGCTVGQFGAVAWIYQGSSFYYCEYSFNQTTLAAAKAASASTANTSNTASGCAGFSWTKYNRL